MNRQHFDTRMAWTEALTNWQDESWQRQGKPDWELKVVQTKLDPVTLVVNVDVLGGSELFLASLPAKAFVSRTEIN
jgi:hypothetical protein